jgi:hypothetical protein
MSSSIGSTLSLVAGLLLIPIIVVATQPAFDVTNAYNTAIGGIIGQMPNWMNMQIKFDLIVGCSLVIVLAFILPIFGFEDASTMFRVFGSNKVGKAPKRGKK